MLELVKYQTIYNIEKQILSNFQRALALLRRMKSKGYKKHIKLVNKKIEQSKLNLQNCQQIINHLKSLSLSKQTEQAN